MGEINKHGLPRYIPADIRREVRRACGFGCVICGGVLIQYEHVVPTFADAVKHEPDKMALLCPTCHDMVTRKFMSKERVIEAMADPICKRRGFSSQVFELGKVEPAIVFGGVTLRECSTPVRIFGVKPFEFKKGAEAGEPLIFSGAFFDSLGQLSLDVEENEWCPQAGNWDVEAKGGALIIKDAEGHVSLHASFDTPGAVVIERMDMLVPGARLVGSPEGLEIHKIGGGTISLSGQLADGYQIGLELREDGSLTIGSGGPTKAAAERAMAQQVATVDLALAAEINALCDEADALLASNPISVFFSGASLRHALLRKHGQGLVDAATEIRRIETVQKLSEGYASI